MSAVGVTGAAAGVGPQPVVAGSVGGQGRQFLLEVGHESRDQEDAGGGVEGDLGDLLPLPAVRQGLFAVCGDRDVDVAGMDAGVNAGVGSGDTDLRYVADIFDHIEQTG
ncbi:hypothetical protein [Streptomyces collinus]|uniref:hypothetical protein n=1 Tax=Streptomyces collinus TaxID=42684 RepID=UPI003440B08E